MYAPIICHIFFYTAVFEEKITLRTLNTQETSVVLTATTQHMWWMNIEHLKFCFWWDGHFATSWSLIALFVSEMSLFGFFVWKTVAVGIGIGSIIHASIQRTVSSCGRPPSLLLLFVPQARKGTDVVGWVPWGWKISPNLRDKLDWLSWGIHFDVHLLQITYRWLLC